MDRLKSTQQTLSVMQAERIAEELSAREGTRYKFFKFLNLARFSLVFISETNEQRVLTIDNAKNLLNKGEY
jgi:hypothetical protein